MVVVWFRALFTEVCQFVSADIFLILSIIFFPFLPFSALTNSGNAPVLKSSCLFSIRHFSRIISEIS